MHFIQVETPNCQLVGYVFRPFWTIITELQAICICISVLLIYAVLYLYTGFYVIA
jgi:hypothetical protein